MNFFLFLVVMLTWGIQPQDGIDILFRKENLEAGSSTWRLHVDYQTDLECNMRCDVGAIESNHLLFVGTWEKKIRTYGWQARFQRYALNEKATVDTRDTPFHLMMDTVRNRLVSVEPIAGADENVELFDMWITPPKLIRSAYEINTFSNLQLHNSGNFLLTVDESVDGDVLVIEINGDSSLSYVASYSHPRTGGEKIALAFHPVAHDLVAVAYPSLMLIKFYRFDTATKNLSFIADVEDKARPNTVIFSHDGMHMFVTNDNYTVLSYSVAVDVEEYTVTVTPIDGSVNFSRNVGGGKDNDFFVQIAITPLTEFLYIIADRQLNLTMIKINPTTKQLSPIANMSVGVGYPLDVAVSPDGTQLLLLDETEGIYIFNIQNDGTLKDAGKVKGLTNAKSMLFGIK